MKKFITAIATVLLTGVVALTGLAGKASAQPSGGTERFTIILTGDAGRGQVIANGAFSAVGTDVEQPSNGPTGQGTLTFPNGTVTLIHTDNPGPSGTFNSVTCVSRFSGTGTYVISNGTGAYAGISGNGSYHFSGFAVGAHIPNGCSDAPIAFLAVTRAGGPVSFSA